MSFTEEKYQGYTLETVSTGNKFHVFNNSHIMVFYSVQLCKKNDYKIKIDFISLNYYE